MVPPKRVNHSNKKFIFLEFRLDHKALLLYFQYIYNKILSYSKFEILTLSVIYAGFQMKLIFPYHCYWFHGKGYLRSNTIQALNCTDANRSINQILIKI